MCQGEGDIQLISGLSTSFGVHLYHGTETKDLVVAGVAHKLKVMNMNMHYAFQHRIL